MGWRTASALMAVAFLLGQPARAGVSAGAYAEAVRLIETLYLYPTEVNAGSMLRAAARSLADRVEWLMVEEADETVYLLHGSGVHLGSVSVASLQTLPEALIAIEDLVERSGFEADGVDVRLALLGGMTRALDRYTTVLAGDKLDRFDVRLKGTLVGVGLTLRARGDALVVTEVLAGGPASKAGVQVGDLVLRVDGLSTVNLPVAEAAKRLRGVAGSSVVVSLLRDGQRLDLPVVRAELVVPNVEHRALEGGVGYVRISHFSQQTDENLRAALADLVQAGSMTRGLVIDLRGNTGGSMKDSARSADELVQEGVLLRTVGPDGGRVRNLQSRMDAVASGTEPRVPVVVLMDRRTASGSEIMAGALKYLDRAALVGSRSFGKGTVQKVYPIDAEARLKLTVAKYLLADDRPITDDGIEPDLWLEEVVFDEHGVRVRRDEGLAFAPTTVRVLVDADSARGPRDWKLEIARRAASGASGPTRASVLESLERSAVALRTEQQALLAEALRARGVDWSPDPRPRPPQTAPRLDLTFHETAAPDGGWIVRVEAVNQEASAVYQAWVELDSQDYLGWHGVAFPLGKIPPLGKAESTFKVPRREGAEARQDEVVPRLQVVGRPEVTFEPLMLTTPGFTEPELSASVRWVEDAGGPRAEVTLRNLSETTLYGLEVAFGHPGDLDVELVDHAASVRELRGRGAARVVLEVRVGESAPDRLPLGLVVSRPGSSIPLLEWPVELARDGAAVDLRAPQIDVDGGWKVAPVGSFQLPVRLGDESGIDHAVIYANGQKVGWVDGAGAKTLSWTPQVSLRAGVNRVVIVAYDDQGLSRRRTLFVRGEAPISVDAE